MSCVYTLVYTVRNRKRSKLVNNDQQQNVRKQLLPFVCTFNSKMLCIRYMRTKIVGKRERMNLQLSVSNP